MPPVFQTLLEGELATAIHRLSFSCIFKGKCGETRIIGLTVKSRGMVI